MSGPVFLIVAAIVGVGIVGVLAWSLMGADPDELSALRRYGPPLGPGDVQAIQDAEACALTQPTPAVGPSVEAIPITELAPWPVDDFAAWEKELTNR